MPHSALATGTRDEFHWLTHTEKHSHDLLYAAPELVMSKYLAITSNDSGELPLTKHEMQQGWTSVGGIRYSPKIITLEEIPHQVDGLQTPGFDEYYVTIAPANLGRLQRKDIFNKVAGDQSLIAFVNLFAFNLALQDPGPQYLTGLFWSQLKRVRPVTYFSDGRDCLTFVSRDESAFQKVLNDWFGFSRQAVE